MAGRDVESIRSLLRIVPELYPSGDTWMRQRLSDVLSGKAECRIVEVDSRMAAVAILTPKGTSLTKISTFFVAEQARRRHVGTLLLESILHDLDRAGVLETYITVAHHIARPLMQLLLPTGFTPVALERDRYGEGRHELVLTRLKP